MDEDILYYQKKLVYYYQIKKNINNKLMDWADTNYLSRFYQRLN